MLQRDTRHTDAKCSAVTVKDKNKAAEDINHQCDNLHNTNQHSWHLTTDYTRDFQNGVRGTTGGNKRVLGVRKKL